MSEDKIPPSKKVYNEALQLSVGILKNIELAEISLELITLKTIRLARLINDYEMVRIMDLEQKGYPRSFDPLYGDVEEQNKFREYEKLAKIAKRLYIDDDALVFIKESIPILEGEKKNIFAAMAVVSELEEYNKLQKRFQKVSEHLASRRSFIHTYVTKKYLELNYSNIAEDIFSVIRQNVDYKIGEIIPQSIEKFTAMYENLTSENSENWSNAVHNCRRLLKDLADNLYPPHDSIKKIIYGKEKTIKLDEEHYINRLMEFITTKSDSKLYKKIVGSHLDYIGDRLDAIYEASNKGTHEEITSKREAYRIVVYTYLLIGDILTLT